MSDNPISPTVQSSAWEEIARIAKRGNDAIVKIRGGEVQVVEAERKVRFRGKINNE